MTLTFLKSERAIDYLRWGGAFVTVVLVYGVAGWLLLRPTGWQRGVNGSVVEIDLSDPTRVAAAPPADRETPSSVERRGVPGPEGQGVLPGDQQDVAAKDRADEPVKTQPGAPAEKASETARTDATDSGGAGRPVAAPPRLVTPDHSNAASIMHAPIDTSITVNQSGRSLLRSAKGGPQFRGAQAPQLKLAPLAATSPLLATSKGRNDLFSKKPTPIAGSTIPLPGPAASANHGYTLNLAHQPTMGADGRPARNAIGAIIERNAGVRAGAPLGIHPLSGASAIHTAGERGPATTATGAPLAANALKPGATGLPAGAANQGHAGRPDQAAIQGHAGRPDQASPASPIATIGGPAIGGTAMIRPGSSIAAVRGSAKAATGAISGSNVRTRHP